MLAFKNGNYGNWISKPYDVNDFTTDIEDKRLIAGPDATIYAVNDEIDEISDAVNDGEIVDSGNNGEIAVTVNNGEIAVTVDNSEMAGNDFEELIKLIRTRPITVVNRDGEIAGYKEAQS